MSLPAKFLLAFVAFTSLQPCYAEDDQPSYDQFLRQAGADCVTITQKGSSSFGSLGALIVKFTESEQASPTSSNNVVRVIGVPAWSTSNEKNSYEAWKACFKNKTGKTAEGNFILKK